MPAMEVKGAPQMVEVQGTASVLQSAEEQFHLTFAASVNASPTAGEQSANEQESVHVKTPAIDTSIRLATAKQPVGAAVNSLAKVKISQSTFLDEASNIAVAASSISSQLDLKSAVQTPTGGAGSTAAQPEPDAGIVVDHVAAALTLTRPSTGPSTAAPSANPAPKTAETEKPSPSVTAVAVSSAVKVSARERADSSFGKTASVHSPEAPAMFNIQVPANDLTRIQAALPQLVISAEAALSSPAAQGNNVSAASAVPVAAAPQKDSSDLISQHEGTGFESTAGTLLGQQVQPSFGETSMARMSDNSTAAKLSNTKTATGTNPLSAVEKTEDQSSAVRPLVHSSTDSSSPQSHYAAGVEVSQIETPSISVEHRGTISRVADVVAKADKTTLSKGNETQGVSVANTSVQASDVSLKLGDPNIAQQVVRLATPSPVAEIKVPAAIGSAKQSPASETNSTRIDAKAEDPKRLVSATSTDEHTPVLSTQTIAGDDAKSSAASTNAKVLFPAATANVEGNQPGSATSNLVPSPLVAATSSHPAAAISGPRIEPLTARLSDAIGNSPAPASTLAESQRTSTDNPKTLEVGLQNGTEGWLRIRAETSQGQVSASIAATSDSGQELLRRQLPALNAYLHSEQLAVTTTVSERPLGWVASGHGALNSDSSSSNQSGQPTGMFSQAQGGESDFSSNRESSKRELLSGYEGVGSSELAIPSLGLGSGPESTSAENGRWLNVRV